jgi:prolyl-tRNA synthetase
MNYLTPRSENYSKWYNELVYQSGLAENSGIRGCMIIKPYGLNIWEKIQDELDKRFKYTGHENVYFPLFIPKSNFLKEAAHAKGFSKECAVVTHYRLKKNKNYEIIIDPESKLEEELVVRPTSESIIWNTYRKWIKSYRDLPILLNQWSNVIRWEMRPRFFVRTSEFLWQEGHTAHSSREEAIREAQKILEIYKDFMENFLAIPVIKGIKTPFERFSGAEETYCLETIMQDNKALQAATSHFLGQNFSRSFNVKFINKNGIKEYAWATSWGISTRLIGALIMTHSDDKGLVLPPSLAPIKVVIVPVYKNWKQLNEISSIVDSIKSFLKSQKISVIYDNRDSHSPGWKFNEYDMKGIPLRIVIGTKDLEKGTVELFRRDTLQKKKISIECLPDHIPDVLNKIQKDLYLRASERRERSLRRVNNYEEFKKVLEKKGGLLWAHWDGTSITEKKIKLETRATIRCIPIGMHKESGNCIYSGNISKQRVLFARAY